MGPEEGQQSILPGPHFTGQTPALFLDSVGVGNVANDGACPVRTGIATTHRLTAGFEASVTGGHSIDECSSLPSALPKSDQTEGALVPIEEGHASALTTPLKPRTSSALPCTKFTVPSL